jgi:hypothetical protein
VSIINSAPRSSHRTEILFEHDHIYHRLKRKVTRHNEFKSAAAAASAATAATAASAATSKRAQCVSDRNIAQWPASCLFDSGLM